MTKQNIFLIIGVVIIASSILVGVLFLQSKKETSENGGDSQRFSFKTAVGKKAPDFVLKDSQGNDISLASMLGKNVILFFNEGLMCYPACLDQVVELNKDPKLNNDEVAAFSIVVDSPKSWQDAQKDLPYLAGSKILFDQGAKISRMYDTLALPSSMHRGAFPGHTYYLIDKEGTVRYVLDDPYMAIRNSELAKEVEKL